MSDKLPDELYYVEPIADKNFTSTPTGDLDIGKMVSGAQKCWKTTAQIASKKPKTIVLCDWSSSKSTDIQSIKQYCQNLLDQGFTIYVWSDDKLEELNDISTISNQHLKYVLQNIKISTYKELQDKIIHACAEKGIAQDTLMLFDYFTAHKFIHHDINPTFHASDFLGNETWPILVEIIKEAQVKYIEIKMAKLSGTKLEPMLNTDSKFLERLISFFQKQPVRFTIYPENISFTDTILPEMSSTCSLWLPYVNALSFAAQVCKDSSKMEALLRTLSEIKFENLERININDKDILKKDTALQNFVQKICSAKPNMTLNTPFSENTSLMKVQKIDINNIDPVDFVNLCRFLKVNPQLSAIKLLGNISMQEENRENLTANSLPSLRSLCILGVYGENTSGDNLTMLTKAAPNLEKITVCALIGDINLEPNSLLSLRNLAICGDISAENLVKLLQAAPNINELKITGTISGTIEDLPELPVLKKIDFSTRYMYGFSSEKPDLNGELLFLLLTYAKNLKQLNLHGRTIIDDIDNPFQIFPHDTLEAIEITCAEFKDTDDSLKAGLQECSVLQQVFSKAKIIDDTKEEILAYERLQASTSRSSEHDVLARHTDSDSISSSSGPIKLSSKQDALSCDTNTEKSSTTFNLHRYLFGKTQEHPAPNNYRINVRDKFVLQESSALGSPFTCVNDSADLQLQPIDLAGIKQESSVYTIFTSCIDTEEVKHLYGKVEVPADNQWYALPSLTPQDVLHNFYASGNVEIQYSARDNLYYVRSQMVNAAPLTIDYILQVSNQPPTLDVVADKEILDIIAKYKKFGSGRLTGLSANPTPEEQIKAIIEQKKGACRHRAAACMYEIQQLNRERTTPIRARAIYNDCHAYIEVLNHEGKWAQCDLGGYPAKLNITEPHLGTEPTVALPTKVIETLINTSPFDKAFAVWEKPEATNIEPEIMFQQLFASSKNKTLVDVTKTASLPLAIELQKYAKSVSKNIFYVNEPDDLLCSKPWIDKDGNIQQTPGGALYRFLQANEEQKIIIVNYNNFSASDLVKFNSMLDEIRKVDGIDLAANVHIIGLLDSAVAPAGADFYSRFDKKMGSPKMPKDALSKLLPKPQQEGAATPITINLHNSSLWESLLIGQLVLEQDKLAFIPGALLNALKSRQPICLQNAPWYNPDFCLWWYQAWVNEYVEINGERFHFNRELFSTEQDKYEFGEVYSSDLEVTVDDWVLNPSSLMRFLQGFTISAAGKFTNSNGLLASCQEAKKSSLTVFLTEQLSQSGWSLLLATAQEHKVKIIIKNPHGFKLPFILTPAAEPSPTSTLATNFELSSVVSTDVDFTLEELSGSGNAIRIDVSEFTANDLLVHLDAKFHKETNTFTFSTNEAAILTSLRQGKHVILHGDFSAELLDNLWFHIHKEKQQLPGKLTIVTEQELLVPPYCRKSKVEVTATQKKIKLAEFNQDKEAIITQLPDSLPYSQMQAITACSSSIEQHWQGLETNPVGACIPDDETEAFERQRVAALKKALANFPIAVITGATGVGKSTFMHKVLAEQPNHAVYSEEKIADWVQHEPGKTKILFIDEANIGTTDWVKFAGLFNKPPYILGPTGEIIELTPNHKVVFACNPSSYGAGRKVPRFFKQHGNTVLFKPMPIDYIKERILTPLMQTLSPEQQTIVNAQLGAIYSFICSCSTNEILITPRHLEMIALLVVQSYPANKSLPMKDLATHYGSLVARHLVPTDKLEEFDRDFAQPVIHIQRKVAGKIAQQYTATPSRQPLIDTLTDLLQLREFKQTKGSATGGLGGIIIEGEPGIGKTELVMQTLRAHKKDGQDIFCYIPVGMDLEKKQKLLLEALDKGLIVVIDEINSSPMLERWLNDLLMGIHPITKQPPTTPGFMLIGTQNPISMRGRHATSKAILNRTMQCVLPEYSPEEMLTILHKRCPTVEDKILDQIIEAYARQRHLAQEQHLQPIPTFRDILKLTEEIHDRRIHTAVQCRVSPDKETTSPMEEASLASKEQTDSSSAEQSSVSSTLSKPQSLVFSKLSDNNQPSHSSSTASKKKAP